MKRIIFLTTLIYLFSFNAKAGVPVCNSDYGGYCAYRGNVKGVYVNAANMILINFDTPINVSDAGIAGFTITNGGAAAFPVSDNPEFAKMFYSTALSAQATNRNISIQMHGVYGGYLKFDRIWLYAP